VQIESPHFLIKPSYNVLNLYLIRRNMKSKCTDDAKQEAVRTVKKFSQSAKWLNNLMRLFLPSRGECKVFKWKYTWQTVLYCEQGKQIFDRQRRLLKCGFSVVSRECKGNCFKLCYRELRGAYVFLQNSYGWEIFCNSSRSLLGCGILPQH